MQETVSFEGMKYRMHATPLARDFVLVELDDAPVDALLALTEKTATSLEYKRDMRFSVAVVDERSAVILPSTNTKLRFIETHFGRHILPDNAVPLFDAAQFDNDGQPDQSTEAGRRVTSFYEQAYQVVRRAWLAGATGKELREVLLKERPSVD